MWNLDTMVSLRVGSPMIELSKFITFVIISVLFGAVISMSFANETIQIFDNETFEISVNDVGEAIYTFDFEVFVPVYTNATLFFEYTNEVDGVITERCTLLEISVYIDSKVVFTKKLSSGAQGVTLEQPVLIQSDKNCTGQLVLFGTSDYKFMGTVTMYIVCTSGSSGFNPFDFGGNWVFYTIIISSVSFVIAVLLIRRRRSAEV